MHNVNVIGGVLQVGVVVHQDVVKQKTQVIWQTQHLILLHMHQMNYLKLMHKIKYLVDGGMILEIRLLIHNYQHN